MLTLFVDFYDTSHGAAKIIWEEKDLSEGDLKERRLTETLLFACFTIRQLHNLGNHPATRALARELHHWNPHTFTELPKTYNLEDKAIAALPQHVIYSAALDMGMDYETVNKKYGEPLMLVDHRGTGKRSFIGKMHLTAQKPTFFLKTKGFGLGGIFGLGITQYATDSVILPLAYLALRYSEARGYADRLRAVASSCAEVYSLKRITTMNQESLAVQIVNEHFLETL